MHRFYVEGPERILVTDTITILEADDTGAVVVSGSHGGVSSAQFVIGRKLRGVFYNDAGVGKDGAGIAALSILDRQQCAAATMDHRTARIGEGEDTWENGVVSHANARALATGVTVGMPVATAALLMARAAPETGTIAGSETPGKPQLARREVILATVPLLLLDSISMVKQADRGRFVVSGSHGGAVSAEFASRNGVDFALFNDAGVGKDGAGVAALSILDAAGIPAGAVDASTGRIGDPSDMLAHGRLSHVNSRAAALGFNTTGSLSYQIERLAAGLPSGMAGTGT